MALGLFLEGSCILDEAKYLVEVVGGGRGRPSTVWYTTPAHACSTSQIALAHLIALLLSCCHTHSRRGIQESACNSPNLVPENPGVTRSDMPEESGQSPAV